MYDAVYSDKIGVSEELDEPEELMSIGSRSPVLTSSVIISLARSGQWFLLCPGFRHSLHLFRAPPRALRFLGTLARPPALSRRGIVFPFRPFEPLPTWPVPTKKP